MQPQHCPNSRPLLSSSKGFVLRKEGGGGRGYPAIMMGLVESESPNCHASHAVCMSSSTSLATSKHPGCAMVQPCHAQADANDIMQAKPSTCMHTSGPARSAIAALCACPANTVHRSQHEFADQVVLVQIDSLGKCWSLRNHLQAPLMLGGVSSRSSTCRLNCCTAAKPGWRLHSQQHRRNFRAHRCTPVLRLMQIFLADAAWVLYRRCQCSVQTEKVWPRG